MKKLIESIGYGICDGVYEGTKFAVGVLTIVGILDSCCRIGKFLNKYTVEEKAEEKKEELVEPATEE